MSIKVKLFPRKSKSFWLKRARGVTTWYQSFGLSELGVHYRLPSFKPLVEALNVCVSNAEVIVNMRWIMLVVRRA